MGFKACIGLFRKNLGRLHYRQDETVCLKARKHSEERDIP